MTQWLWDDLDELYAELDRVEERRRWAEMAQRQANEIGDYDAINAADREFDAADHAAAELRRRIDELEDAIGWRNDAEDRRDYWRMVL